MYFGIFILYFDVIWLMLLLICTQDHCINGRVFWLLFIKCDRSVGAKKRPVGSVGRKMQIFLFKDGFNEGKIVKL